MTTSTDSTPTLLLW